MFQKTKLAIAIASTITLTACGGGGGGGGGVTSAIIRSEVPYYTPVHNGNFNYYTNTSNNAPVVHEIYTYDLNNDNADEVIFAGRQTQPSTQQNWNNSNISIFGWNNSNSLTNETSIWFNGISNEIIGTEPSVEFGDFNNDGNTDMFVAHGTDMAYYANDTVFINNGNNSFNRQNVTSSASNWGHGSAVTDLNNDGYDDVIVSTLTTQNTVIKLGRADGNFNSYTASSFYKGPADVSVADYMNDGTKTLIFTGDKNNTKLYSWNITNNNLTFTEIASLPSKTNPNSNYEVAGIRNIAFDFNNDGLTDNVIIWNGQNKNTSLYDYTDVQFLKNNGGGVFTDVTSDTVQELNTSRHASYHPIIIDVNNDGLDDIFLSSIDYNGSANSTFALLQTSEGKYVDSFEGVFTDFWNQSKNLTSDAHSSGQSINIVSGPDNKRYLITTVAYTNSNGGISHAVYTSLIGSSGTINAQATIDLLNQSWPYMSAVENNEVLAKTASTYFNGYDSSIYGAGIIDLYSVLNPIGNLEITLNGRTASTIPITGSLSLPNINSDILQHISSLVAVDDFDRDFNVNLSSMYTNTDFNINKLLTYNNELPMSQNFIDAKHSNNGIFNISNNDSEFSVGITHRKSKNLHYNMSLTHSDTNPWLNISGMWGNINSSTTADISMTYTHEDTWVQVGGMYTNTDLERGLVTNISPISSWYTINGKSFKINNENFSLYSGIKPTIFNGDIEFTLPTSVDNNGIMHYTNTNSTLKTNAVAFVGMNWTFQQHNTQYSFHAIADDTKDYNLSIQLDYNF